jgi:hypothetical protein
MTGSERPVARSFSCMRSWSACAVVVRCHRERARSKYTNVRALFLLLRARIYTLRSNLNESQESIRIHNDESATLLGLLSYRARIHHIKLLHHQLARGLLGLNFLGVVAKFHAARHAG